MFLSFRCIVFLKFCMLFVTETMAVDSAEDSEFAPKIAKKQTHLDDIKRLGKDVHCKLQANKYPCSKLLSSTKYYFDLQLQECVRFNYGHCPNTFNKFDGRHDCMVGCQDDAYKTIPENLTANIFCRFQPDFGKCDSYIQMYYFDISEFTCRGFGYSGCGGNRNRFMSSQLCASVCGSVLKAPS